MSAPVSMPRRVVIDTNVVVALLVFADPRYVVMLDWLERRRWHAVTDERCLDELQRVLARAQFALDDATQLAYYARWRRLSTHRAGAAQSSYPLPVCRDPDDQKFLELARDGDAQWLITDDKALLALARRRKLADRFRILTPAAAVACEAG